MAAPASMRIQFASPDADAENYYRYAYALSEEEMERRGGLQPGETLDSTAIKGATIGRDPRVERTVCVWDARALEEQPTLGREGFCLMRHATPPPAFDLSLKAKDEEGYRQWVLCEVLPRAALLAEEAVRASFGDVVASYCLNYSLRCTDNVDGARFPSVGIAHTDFTLESGAKRLEVETPVFSKGVSPSPEAPLGPSEKHSYLFVNVWQPLVPVKQKPLIMCDRRTFSTDQAISLKVYHPQRVGVISVSRPAEGQQWYWYPDMDAAEALVFITWSPRGTSVLHGAADNLADPDDAAPRRSLETRWVIQLASANDI